MCGKSGNNRVATGAGGYERNDQAVNLIEGIHRVQYENAPLAPLDMYEFLQPPFMLLGSLDFDYPRRTGRPLGAQYHAIWRTVRPRRDELKYFKAKGL